MKQHACTHNSFSNFNQLSLRAINAPRSEPILVFESKKKKKKKKSVWERDRKIVFIQPKKRSRLFIAARFTCVAGRQKTHVRSRTISPFAPPRTVGWITSSIRRRPHDDVLVDVAFLLRPSRPPDASFLPSLLRINRPLPELRRSATRLFCIERHPSIFRTKMEKHASGHLLQSNLQ